MSQTLGETINFLLNESICLRWLDGDRMRDRSGAFFDAFYT